MRATLITLWMFAGLAGLIFHWGPGRELEKYDSINQQVDQARQKVSLAQWPGAIDSFDAALASVPEERLDLTRRLRLEKAKAQMQNAQLPDARLGLESLLDELVADQQGESELAKDTRQALATSQYYVTWLMRLEGSPQAEWEPEIEAARQNYRLLAEQAEQTNEGFNSDESKQRREDLESTIRLARMDLSELQALPIPSQCKGCSSCKCKGKKKGKRKGEKPSQGASDNPPGEHFGS